MDSPPFTGKLASAREKGIEKLVQGREFAAQLQLVLHDQVTGTAHESTMTAKNLVTKMLRSFTEPLSILGYTESGKVSGATSPPCQKQLKKQPKKRHLQEMQNFFIHRNMQDTWTRITCAPIEDGYAWRKYGQKEILNAKHLRCSYRFDLGCQATKQVQRIEDERPTFWTKYVGYYTCQDTLKATMGMDSTVEKGVWLSFNLNATTKQGPPHFLSFLPSLNEECYKKSAIPSEEEGYKPILPSGCFSPAQDLNTKFKSSMNPPLALPSTLEWGPEDPFSGSSSTSSSSNFDTDMYLIDPVCLSSL